MTDKRLTTPLADRLAAETINYLTAENARLREAIQHIVDTYPDSPLSAIRLARTALEDLT